MGRSGRPKKAVREEYYALKELLSECHRYDWQRAQGIFDKMNALIGAEGPSGALMIPRACRACGYYGHSRDRCHVTAARQHLEAQLRAAESRPVTEEECTPTQWHWVCKFRRKQARFEEALAMGLEGCSDSECSTCAACVAWFSHMHS